MCVCGENSATMIRRNMDRNEENTPDERPMKNEDLHKAGSMNQEIAGIALPHAGVDALDVSGNVVGLANGNKISNELIAPHKKLNTIRTKIEEEDEEDANNLLSDEEIAWKLHQELNSGSPVLRTRSQRGGSKPRSSLAEPALQGAAREKKKHGSTQGDDPSHSGDKKRRGSRLVMDQDTRKSPRVHAPSELPSATVEDQGVLKGPVKARSRKGKPQIAAQGIDEHKNNNVSNAKKHTDGRRKTAKVLPKIPKLPMVRQGNHWYRARVLKEDKHRILVEFAGYEHSLPSTWIPKYCQRVWLGSYKGKDWRYQGEGAWVPKNGIQNRVINAQDYGIENEFVDDVLDESGMNTDETLITGRKTPVVGTPNLIPDVALVNPQNGQHKRKRKSNLSDKDANNTQRSNRRVRGRKKANSEDSDSKTRQTSSKSVDYLSREESETGRRDRPRRNTKPTAILNSDDFAVDAEVDMMDSELQNGYMDTAYGHVPHSKPNAAQRAWNVDKRRKHMYYNDSPGICLNSRDEQEALAALAEMPSSPASWQGMRNDTLENTREALLEAYANGKSFSYSGKMAGKNSKRLPYKSEPDLHRSHTAQSISVAEQMFGDLLHAISSRLGNGIQRSMSMPTTNISGSRNHRWSPHVWSSGVNPADSEPAIVHVPNSLIQKALLSPKHMDATKRTSPVPLFY